ncbi:MAG: diguanylate cyclase [Dehalococcoidia bacterium]|nr:diguanylate cyclase [Dehalococcoidia bacterium]
MRRTVRRWLHMAAAIPVGPGRGAAITRRAALAAGMVLLVGEASVAIRYSGHIGLLLIVTTAGLSAFVYRGIQALDPDRDTGDARDGHGDERMGAVGRQQLIDTLSRDIARSERYAHALTLAVIKVSQFEELRGAWGEGTARLAVDHVAETLVRITRGSDFHCRLDDSTFAVVLLQCTGRQAALYGDRLSLAVSNRPLKSASHVKVPLYVGVEVNALEYDASRFRGPLEFLSLAGGDVMPERLPRAAGARTATASDPRGLREQLVKDYYPGGEMKDFADAYREARNRNRHAG